MTPQIKHKTQFVLHRAIKHSREDVVFLFLIEFDLQLREKLNEVCRLCCLSSHRPHFSR